MLYLVSRRHTSLLVAVAMFVVASTNHPIAAQQAATTKHVVLVSVDGLSATYFNQPQAPMPNLRRLARQGARAEGMQTVFPSVTWPAHVSLVTGVAPARHGVIGNSVYDRNTFTRVTYIGDPVFTKDECIKSPTLYDAAHGAGLKTAAIIWPASNGAKTLDWVIPDSNQQRIHDRYTTPGLAQELDKAGVSIARLGAWGWDHKYSAMRDSVYTRVAAHLLREHRPNLLLLHLITPDGFEHDYGPDVEEAYWACNNADDRIGELWQALQTPPLKGRSTLIVVSDHGFAEYTKLIQVNVLLKNMGLIEIDEAGNVTKRRAWSHSSGGSAVVYVMDGKNNEALIDRLKPLLADLPGVDKVLDAAQFARYGQPHPDKNPQQGHFMLSAKPGFAFSNEHKPSELIAPTEGRRGAHGHLPDQRFMHATFVASGAGIKKGVELKQVSCLDVAPTVAKLLGIELPSAEGRVLSEILEPPQK